MSKIEEAGQHGSCKNLAQRREYIKIPIKWRQEISGHNCEDGRVCTEEGDHILASLLLNIIPLLPVKWRQEEPGENYKDQLQAGWERLQEENPYFALALLSGIPYVPLPVKKKIKKKNSRRKKWS